MTAKNFLRQALDTYRRINIRLEYIARLVEITKRVTTIISDTAGKGSAKSLLEISFVKVTEQKAMLENDIRFFFKVLDDISNVVERITDNDEKLILEYRYLAFLGWKDVASSLVLSLQHVYRLHDRAVKSVEKILSSAENESK